MNNLCTDIGYLSLNKWGEQLCGDRVEVVPPQTMCFPSLEKNRDMYLLTSLRSEGGPIIKFTCCRSRTFTTQTVVSSPGWPPYKWLHSSSRREA